MQIDTETVLNVPVEELNLTVPHQMALREKGLPTVGAIIASDFDMISVGRSKVYRRDIDTAVAEYVGKMVLAYLNPRYKENSDA